MLSATSYSLKRRYAYKIGFNCISAVASAVTQFLVPRALGPSLYGDLSFLSNFFQQSLGFLDMGTSLGIYTKLAQRPNDRGLRVFFVYFAGAVCLLLVCGLILALHSSYKALLWPGQRSSFIGLAALFAVLMWLVQLLNGSADAFGLTVFSEQWKLAQKLVGVSLVVVLFYANLLGLSSYFYSQYIALLFGIGVMIWLFRNNGQLSGWQWILAKKELKQYGREMYRYSHPLMTYSLVGVLTGLADRWILQRYAGSAQQGFFSLSYQLGAVCFLFTGAMTPLLMREFSLAHERNDLREMARLFRRHIPVLYSLAAFLSCFIALQAGRIAGLIGGRDFGQAKWAVALMAFYPVHQTYGQLSGSVYYATGRTVLYRNVGSVCMLLGLPVTYLAVAPVARGGLGAGAMGLALKTIALQILTVNVLLYFNARLLKLCFWRYLAHQGTIVTIFLMFAAAARMVASRFLPLSDWAQVTGSGFLYMAVAGVVVYRVPRLVGLGPQDTEALRARFWSIF